MKCTLVCITLTAFCGNMFAADPPRAKPPVENKSAERGPKDRAELEAFLDGVLGTMLKHEHIAGATIAVVVDNKPFFSKGYGYADFTERKPVAPAATMFRIASISKLFTWTAVMQLAEQGKLDLDADVNTYLTQFKIPTRRYPQPITLKHLMSHTPGFEDHVLGLFAKTPDKLLPLGQILAKELPARVRPPNELSSYSNHGTAIAGYIVAQVSGMSWEDYVEKNILKPLEMSNTLVRQPKPEDLPAAISKGYKWEGGKYKEKGFEYVPISPAGCMSAAAVDMTHFMISH
ncbi:MAG: serine hydrolase domain-containing protein, partial [Candidatus Acidiferrum sp.]